MTAVLAPLAPVASRLPGIGDAVRVPPGPSCLVWRTGRVVGVDLLVPSRVQVNCNGLLIYCDRANLTLIGGAR
jgi:hypothetical protein